MTRKYLTHSQYLHDEKTSPSPILLMPSASKHVVGHWIGFGSSLKREGRQGAAIL